MNVYLEVPGQQLACGLLGKRLGERDFRTRSVAAQVTVADGWITEAIVVRLRLEGLKALDEVQAILVCWRPGAGQGEGRESDNEKLEGHDNDGGFILALLEQEQEVGGFLGPLYWSRRSAEGHSPLLILLIVFIGSVTPYSAAISTVDTRISILVERRATRLEVQKWRGYRQPVIITPASLLHLVSCAVNIELNRGFGPQD